MKKPITIGKKLAGPSIAETKESSSLFVVFFAILSSLLIITLLIIPRKIRNIKKIPIPIRISNKFTPRIPCFQTDKNKSLNLFFQ